MKKELLQLLSYMKKEGISACIIPTADPHLCEYVPSFYKTREYFSGFTGSNGTLVVTYEECGLWTDGRYYVQAEKELFGSGINLYRASEKDCIKIYEFLCEKLSANDIVGLDGKLFSKKELDNLISKLEKANIKVNTCFEAVKIQKERPALSMNKAFILPQKYCGETVEEKVSRVRKIMENEKISHYLTAAPECIMWLLNIRGNDVKNTPLLFSYLIMTRNDIFLYAQAEKTDAKMQNYLKEHNITLKDYDIIYEELAHINENGLLAADFSLCNYNLFLNLKCAYKDTKDFIYNLKCIKTEREIENIKKAYVKENIALTKTFYRIFNEKNLDECDVAEIIEENRKNMEGYFSPSFDTIAAFGENAAMMHYCAKKESCSKIERSGLFLIDTGGQYFEGTTDTTRTLVLGEISREERENLTLVLKGNISLAKAVFPKGALGRDIDILARMPLWKKALDYRCGTGHGIGYFLGVHEGPQRISSASNEKILPMMTLSDEPGVYAEGKYGIRIENHLCVREYKKSEYGTFLSFEVLNYCPIGTKGIEAELLEKDEINYLNAYNERCRQLLEPHLTGEEYEWLKTYTAKI